MGDERLLHLSDEQWAQVEKRLFRNGGASSGFERKISNRLAFRRRCSTGRGWAVRGATCPASTGTTTPVYMRWKRWVKSGVPQRALVASYLEVG